jgi:hypothetical protein
LIAGGTKLYGSQRQSCRPHPRYLGLGRQSRGADREPQFCIEQSAHTDLLQSTGDQQRHIVCLLAYPELLGRVLHVPQHA